MVNKEEQLRVADARQRDIGHGKVRIDNKTMQSLGISARAKGSIRLQNQPGRLLEDNHSSV